MILLLVFKFHDYTWIFLCVALGSLALFVKDLLKDENPWLAFLIFITTVFGGFYTSSDLSKTGRLLDKIDSNTTIIRDTVYASKIVIDKTFNLADTIRNIDIQIQKISKEINNLITGGNSFPRIEFYNQSSPSLERDIILFNVGKYPLHGLYIDIVDEEIRHGYPAVNGYKRFTKHYDIDELSLKKKIDSIVLRLDYNSTKMQTFDIQISAINGKYHERACFITSGYMVNSAYWIIKTTPNPKTNQNIYDTLIKPSASELFSFLSTGKTVQDMLQN